MMELVFMVLGYLLGSIPFALIVVRLVKGVDIREHGSGNVGATNAFRLMGLNMGILVALLDIGKGFLAVSIARSLFAGQPLMLLLVGAMSIVGHNWPIFLKFKGGKGVATSVGVLISLIPQVILIIFLVWISIILTTQYVSLGSVVGAILMPFLILLFGLDFVYLIFATLISLFVIYRHIPNIKRLLAGNETKVSLSKKSNG